MFDRRSVKTWALTHMLPLCLIWALFGCVSVCASHIEDDCDELACSSLADLSSPDTDCCPIIKTAGEISPTRSGNPSGGIDAISLTVHAGNGPVIKTHISIIPEINGSPPERLSILRI